MFHAYFMPTGDLQPSVDILALEHSLYDLDTDAISSVVLIIALTILSQN